MLVTMQGEGSERVEECNRVRCWGVLVSKIDLKDCELTGDSDLEQIPTGTTEEVHEGRRYWGPMST